MDDCEPPEVFEDEIPLEQEIWFNCYDDEFEWDDWEDWWVFEVPELLFEKGSRVEFYIGSKLCCGIVEGVNSHWIEIPDPSYTVHIGVDGSGQTESIAESKLSHRSVIDELGRLAK
jgi:hypothetical protein